MSENPYGGIHWLPEEDYRKAVGQLRLTLNGCFAPFAQNPHYGMLDYVSGAIDGALKA